MSLPVDSLATGTKARIDAANKAKKWRRLDIDMIISRTRAQQLRGLSRPSDRADAEIAAQA
jgi:hypothetical protein